MILAGAAVVEINPPAGLAMCGYAARTRPAQGSHDPLSVRALAVGDTALAVADVIGLERDFCRRVRSGCVLPDDNVLLCALHNHGGPPSMAGRLAQSPADGFMQQLEATCIAAIDQAVAARRQSTLTFGAGADPQVACNRRRVDGPTDPSLPVLRVRDAAGQICAVLVNYACHPVVLGADNLLWTADYPHFVRRDIEAEHPGATAIFVTGCAGDANLGHSAKSSISLAAQKGRDYATAATVGARIAAAALAAPERPLGDKARAKTAEVKLHLHRRETSPAATLAARWKSEQACADPAHAAALQVWIDWAATVAQRPLRPLHERVTALRWGGLPVIGLPGEIFAATGLALRATGLGAEAVLAGFADDNPGYIPPEEEYQFGGYEVDEAHRYYGQPASFAPGSAEALASEASRLLAK